MAVLGQTIRAASLLGFVTLLLIVRYSQAETCSFCDESISPFFLNLTNFAENETAVQVGDRMCLTAETVLQCYYECNVRNHTFPELSYLYSPKVSKGAYAMNEWWKVNCDAGCRMADALVCEHLTYNGTGHCGNIPQWRICVADTMDRYSCDGFCQVSDRWHHAYKLHHEIDCANASETCLDSIKSCLHNEFGFSESPSLDVSYLMSWEFFYNGALPKEFRCQSYKEAEVCFNKTSACGPGNHIHGLQRMLNNAYSSYCNTSVNAEDICMGNDMTTPSTTTEFTSTSSTPAPATTQRTPSTKAPVVLPQITAEPGTCEYCDQNTLLHLQIASLNIHPNRNLTEFGGLACQNYTDASNCYYNCTVDGVMATEELSYYSAPYDTLKTQLILSCDQTCRHTDLWLCEREVTTADWCQEGDYDRWLACYEAGAAMYDCDGACNIAQRRVNTYKIARQISCAARRLAKNRRCVGAVNQCLNTRFSRSDMNFEKFLTANLSSTATCGYFMSGSECLRGVIPVNTTVSNATIDLFCYRDSEKEVLREMDGYWRSVYHHDECASLPRDTSITYHDICDGVEIPKRNTTELCDIVPEEGECTLFSSEACTNPCRHLSAYDCTTRDEWIACTAAHKAATNCTGVCSENERVNAVESLISSINCNLPADVQGDDCKDVVAWNCMTGVWVTSQDMSYDVFTKPDSSLGDWCSKIEQTKACLHNSTYGAVTYFGRTLSAPCSQRQVYMESLMNLMDNLTLTACEAPVSTWQETCPGQSPVNSVGTGEPSGALADADACPADIKNAPGCAGYQMNRCGNNFAGWTRCLVTRGVFDKCTTLCTANRRRAIASYTESYLSCNIDRSPESGYCWEFIENDCLQGMLGDEEYTRFVNDTTVAGLCGLAQRFLTCLENSKTSNVTVPTLNLDVTAPCSSQTRVIDDAKIMFQQAISGGMCQDTSRLMDDFCTPILTGATPINPPPTPLPTTEQSSTTNQAAATSEVSTTQAPENKFKISVKLSLPADYASVVGPNEAQAKEVIKEQIARQLNLPKSAVKNMKLSPGSIVVEFDVVTDDPQVASSSAASLNSGLQPVVIAGSSYEPVVARVSVEENTAVTSEPNEEVTASTPLMALPCNLCMQTLSGVVEYEHSSTNKDKHAYYSTVCSQLTYVTEECLRDCVDIDGNKLSTSSADYVAAEKIKSLWCGSECPFGNLASCYASQGKCSSINANTFDGCLLENYNPKCTAGICTEHQRYALAEKINRHIECFPNDDSRCHAKVSACFDSFRDTSTASSLTRFSKLVTGSELSSTSRLTDVCRFMKGPSDCLVNMDFTKECVDDQEEVRLLADKWRLTFNNDACQDNERVVSLSEKCVILSRMSTTTKPLTVKKPSTTTTSKPRQAGKGKSSQNSSNQISSNTYMTMLTLSITAVLYYTISL